MNWFEIVYFGFLILFLISLWNTARLQKSLHKRTDLLINLEEETQRRLASIKRMSEDMDKDIWGYKSRIVLLNEKIEEVKSYMDQQANMAVEKAGFPNVKIDWQVPKEIW